MIVKMTAVIRKQSTLANAISRTLMGIVKRSYPETPNMKALIVSAKLYDIAKRATFTNDDKIVITFEPITDCSHCIVGIKGITVELFAPKAIFSDPGFTLKPDSDLFTRPLEV
jgi:hypothetical protein